MPVLFPLLHHARGQAKTLKWRVRYDDFGMTRLK
jgi:hypothetical protein